MCSKLIESLDSPTPVPRNWIGLDTPLRITNSSITLPLTPSPTREKPLLASDLVEEPESETEVEVGAESSTPHLRQGSFGHNDEFIEQTNNQTLDQSVVNMNIDHPEFTALEYPSSPPAPATPQRQRINNVQPFTYAESDSDEEDLETGLQSINAIANGASVLGRDSTLACSSGANVQPLLKAERKNVGPFEESDDEEEEGAGLPMECLKKGKNPARDTNTRSAILNESERFPCEQQGQNTVPILLISGEILYVRQKPVKRVKSRQKTFTTEPTYDGDGNKQLNDTYYGVPIHRLLDEVQAERKLATYAKETSLNADSSVQLHSDLSKRSPLPPVGGRLQRTLLWTEKYRAKRFTDLLGDERTHRQVLRWLKQWDDIVFPGSSSKQIFKDNNDYFHKKVLLITGPPGLGKTTLAHVAARQAGYEPLEINASDDRTAGIVKGKIRDVLSNEGVCIPSQGKKKKIGSSKPVCVIVDEIDGVSGAGGETGFMNALVDLILQDQKNGTPSSANTTTRRGKKKADNNFKFHRPIIAICNDLYVPSLRSLRPLAEIVYMRKPPTNLIISRLKWVFEQEGVPCEDAAVRRLVELSTFGPVTQTAGNGGGDMRGCLVSGEWLAKRIAIDSSASACTKLTRKLVEEEFSGREGTGGTRGGVRGCVERVFRKGDDAGWKGSAKGSSKHISMVEVRQREWHALRNEVECCGEFDKIMSDVFSTYLTRPYHDDTRLSKPNEAYEWLWFHDLVCERVFSEQEFELLGYLGIPPMAFNTLFGCSMATAQHGAFANPTGGAKFGEEETDPPPFQGPKAEYDHREGLKAMKTIIQAIQSALLTPPGSVGLWNDTSSHAYATPTAIRLASEFRSQTSLVMELAPYLTKILSPRVNPILIHSGTTGPGGTSNVVASVRKDSEKRLVRRAVEVMFSTNISFEKVRVEFISSTLSSSTSAAAATASGWAYRMDPAFDHLASYPTFSGCAGADKTAVPVPTRYAVRQVLSQELHKYTVLQRQAVRDARMAKLGLDQSHGLDAATLAPRMVKMKVNDPTLTNTTTGRSLKRDFFGRIIEENECSQNQNNYRPGSAGEEGGSIGAPTGKRRRKGDGGDVDRGGKAWVSFNEGFSNAVKKGITLEDLITGLY